MENKNGQGIFYGVIGVATLVVAIIGATFAYFSASATTNYVNAITGNTLDLSDGALSISVTKLDVGGTANAGLVPATIAVDQQSGVPTAAGINDALDAHCEKDGYTGCHVYKIQASSATAMQEAQIKLKTLTTSAATNKTDWKYVIYQGTDSAASSVITAGAMDLATAVDMHASTRTLDSNGVVYYLMIYLAEDNHATEAQNSGGTNDATGTYNGTVELTAGNGTVTANFTA